MYVALCYHYMAARVPILILSALLEHLQEKKAKNRKSERGERKSENSNGSKHGWVVHCEVPSPES